MHYNTTLILNDPLAQKTQHDHQIQAFGLLYHLLRPWLTPIGGGALKIALPEINTLLDISESEINPSVCTIATGDQEEQS